MSVFLTRIISVSSIRRRERGVSPRGGSDASAGRLRWWRHQPKAGRRPGPSLLAAGFPSQPAETQVRGLPGCQVAGGLWVPPARGGPQAQHLVAPGKLWEPPGASGSLREASGSLRGLREPPESFWEPPEGSALGSFWEPPGTSGSPLEASGRLRKALGSFREPPGTLREPPESIWEPPEGSRKLLGASASLREAPGRLRKALGSVRELPGSSDSFQEAAGSLQAFPKAWLSSTWVKFRGWLRNLMSSLHGQSFDRRARPPTSALVQPL
jgi:hypothetical protein